MVEELKKGLAQHIPFAFALGFGLHATWVSDMFYQWAPLTEPLRPHPLSSLYLISIITHTLALICLAAVSHKKPAWLKLLNSAPGFVGIGFATCGGTALVILTNFLSWDAAVFALGAVLTGFGSACALMMWGCKLAELNGKAIAGLCSAYMLSAFLHFVFCSLPPYLAGALISALPCASLAVAWKTNARLRIKNTIAVDAPTNDAPTWHHETMVKPLLAAILFGIAYGIVNGTMRTPGASDDNTFMYTVVHFLACEATLLAMLAYLNDQRSSIATEERFAIVYRFALLLMAGSLLTTLLYDSMYLSVQVIMLVGYNCFRIVLWTILAKIANTRQANPTFVFCLGEAALTTGLAIGTCTTQLLPAFQAISQFDFRVVITTSIAILLVVYLFVLNERQMLAIVGLLGPSAANQQRQKFQTRCTSVAEQYGLSKRESEVMRLFVRGRSAARIAEDLYISKGTVTTHLRNIYRKTDVHGRQELLDLLDSDLQEGE